MIYDMYRFKHRNGFRGEVFFMAAMSLTSLRGKLFKVVDEVIRSGLPAEIERKGHRLRIALEMKKSKLANLKPHDCIVGNPDDLIELKVAQWKETDPL
jgi:hypothetical protein